MYINQESPDQHSIQAYSEHEVKIDSLLYKKSLILSRDELISDWPVQKLSQLNEELLLPLLKQRPKIVLIGHKEVSSSLPLPALQFLSKQQIGLECMSIGAACRTFNILLSEHRDVVLGLLL